MSGLPTSPFWMVYSIGQRAPAYSHPSSDEALAEAKRSARTNPGVVFVVLESIGAVVKDDLRTITFRRPVPEPKPEIDEIPF